MDDVDDVFSTLPNDCCLNKILYALILIAFMNPT